MTDNDAATPDEAAVPARFVVKRNWIEGDELDRGKPSLLVFGFCITSLQLLRCFPSECAHYAQIEVQGNAMAVARGEDWCGKPFAKKERLTRLVSRARPHLRPHLCLHLREPWPLRDLQRSLAGDRRKLRCRGLRISLFYWCLMQMQMQMQMRNGFVGDAVCCLFLGCRLLCVVVVVIVVVDACFRRYSCCCGRRYTL